MTPTPPGTSQQGNHPAGPSVSAGFRPSVLLTAASGSLSSQGGGQTSHAHVQRLSIRPLSLSNHGAAPWIPARVGFSDRVQDSGTKLQFSPVQRSLDQKAGNGGEEEPALPGPAGASALPARPPSPRPPPGTANQPGSGGGVHGAVPSPRSSAIIHRGPARLPPPHLTASSSFHRVPPGPGVSQRWPLQEVG